MANKTNNCFDYECLGTAFKDTVCGIVKNGSSFRIRLFKNYCELIQYNCINEAQFIVTDLFICNDLVIDNKLINNSTNGSVMPKYNHESNLRDNENKMALETKDKTQNTELKRKNVESIENITKIKNIIIVDAPLLNTKDGINETINNFFEATHIFDLPLKDVENEFNETRRMQLKKAGPLKVFKPWITIPENISEDYNHAPTLSSCFHRCPTVILYHVLTCQPDVPVCLVL